MAYNTRSIAAFLARPFYNIYDKCFKNPLFWGNSLTLTVKSKDGFLPLLSQE